MGCCSSEWKRETVQDYKWDYVDVQGFRRNDCWTRFMWLAVFGSIAKDVIILGLDIFTAVTMLVSSNWTNAVYISSDNHCRESGSCPITVKFGIAKWVFCGCIFFSFLLLGWEMYRASRVIKTNDISYCFTNVMANRWVSVRDYNKFCLFRHIGESKKKKDSVAFFVFFSFQDWKRVILSDGPRQSINALILYTIAKNFNFSFDDLPKYWDNSPITALLFWAMVTTVFLFAFGLAKILISGALYLPLLCYIQGNLKEYVCHKVDKRLGKVMRNIQKDRMRRNAKIEKQLAMGGKVKVANGEIVDASLLRPTLPNISLDDGVVGSQTNLLRAGSPAPSIASSRMIPGTNWASNEVVQLVPGGRISPVPNWGPQEKPTSTTSGRLSPGLTWGTGQGSIISGPSLWNSSEISLNAPPVQPASLDDIYDSYSIDDHDPPTPNVLVTAARSPVSIYPPTPRRMSPPEAAAGAPAYPPPTLGPAPPYVPPACYQEAFSPDTRTFAHGQQSPHPLPFGRPSSPLTIPAAHTLNHSQTPVVQRECYEYSAGSFLAGASGAHGYIEGTVTVVNNRPRQSHGW